MLFDTLAYIAERHFPELFAMVNEARLFVFPGRAHEILGKNLTEEEFVFLKEGFFLPFQTIAVEDTGSCVILIDQEPNVKGSKEKRLFIEILPMGQDPDEYADPEEVKQELRKIAHLEKSLNMEPFYVISAGYIVDFEPLVGEDKFGYAFAGDVSVTGSTTKKEVIKPLTSINNLSPDLQNRWVEAALKNVIIAMQEIFYFNNPNRFILEKTPVKTKKKPRDNFIPRSHDRPIYTILTPNEIRKKMGLEESHISHASPIAHERRRHVRVFKHPKFSKMQGKSIIIPASWVGPTETQVKKSRYKVMTEI